MSIIKRRAKSGLRYRAKVQHDRMPVWGKWRDAKWKAQEDEAAMRRAIAAGNWHRSYGPARIPTFAEAAREHLAECERLVQQRKLAPKTLQAKRWHLKKRILPVFGELRVDQIHFLDVERFKREVFKATSGPTANRYLATLSRVLAHARTWLEANPCAGVPRYEETTDAWYAISEQEAEHLIAKAERDINANMGPLLLLLWEAMLRPKSEARVIRLEHIDWRWKHAGARGLIHLPDTKAGEAQAVPMSARLAKRLRQHVHRGSEWLFPNRFATGPLSESAMYVAWSRIKVVAEVSPELRLHDFRHGGATDLIARGASPSKVQRLLRHKTRVMTDRYTHLTEQHAAEALAVRRTADIVEIAGDVDAAGDAK